MACLPAHARPDDLVRHGEYILRAAGCASCHTNHNNDGPFLAGGRRLETPFGTFYTPNITPDPEYGIGRWSDEDFVQALTQGVSPKGRHYYPAFPYTAYTRLRRDDLLALKAYLSTVTPVTRKNKGHELVWYASARSLLWFWKLLYFSPGEFTPTPSQSRRWNRGAYLATAMAHCGECHTPRNALGGLSCKLGYAGTRDGPEGDVVPNITPDRKTGVGRWSRDDLVYFLETGLAPDGDAVGGSMAEVIDDGLRYLKKSDLEAIVTYLLALPPIENAVKRKKKDEFEY